MNRSCRFFSFILLITFLTCKQEDPLRYKDSNLPIEARIDDLLARMTLEEKFWQLFMIPYDPEGGMKRFEHGIFGFQVATKGRSDGEAGQLLDYSGGISARETAELINRLQRYFVEETRLGIPIIPFDEALHGLVREGATAFPQSIGLAATWDTLLIGQVAQVIALETRSRGIRQILSPVLNIARDVRWGRTEETYGEDPFFTTLMGLSFISQFEKVGVIATPKHFVANVGDGGRDSYPIHFSERLLEEVYLPAFRAAVQTAKAGSVMTSYNSLDGRPCTANDWLLNQKLKGEWGFDGFVISDAGAIGGANVLHFTAADYADATQQAIGNGLDVIFQTSFDHYPFFFEAFEKGMVDEKAMDEAVRRVLRAKFRLGLFENPYVKVEEAAMKPHRALAKKAALESIVLLKNEGPLLPLSQNLSSIAVIGMDAMEARLGGYSGPGNEPVSILEGISEKVGPSCVVRYSPGCGRESLEFIPVPANCLFSFVEGEKRPGLKGEYFNNVAFEGEPALRRLDPAINFQWTLYSPDPDRINNDFYSARWTGLLIPPETGRFRIGLEGNDGYRLWINGECLIDNFQKQSFHLHTVDFFLEKGRSYDLKIEFYETTGNARLKLIWDLGVDKDWEKEIQNAVRLAGKSEAAVIVAGIEEGEFRDRSHLSLPGHQEELIARVAATGTPVMVVLVGGSAVTMEKWIDRVPAILDVWYPGDEGGHAVADVLFGNYNPAGRLPITFPIHEGQLPLYYNHKPTGRGDDYLDGTGRPLFPFGFGLSYTSFQYSDLKLDKDQISTGESVTVTFQVTNTGDRDGDEVVQLYIRDLLASVSRPVMELKGFQRVHLKKGETQELQFELTPELLGMLDKNMNGVVEPGDFRIMIGASSNDIRLRGMLRVNGAN